MVLVTDGYTTPNGATQQELTAYLQVNQIRVEHRFFPPSAPTVPDWSKLTIAQSAQDLHAVVSSFKALYPGKWVSTGASKSGMTSVYFRYHFPDDVAATVPYVAPSSHGLSDARYVQFLSRVGLDQCRADLRRFQEIALARRDEVLPLVPDYGFDVYGIERSYEFALLELPFSFWQYSNESHCPDIPGPGASASELLDFIESAIGMSSYGIASMTHYAPYYYQAATQLGVPRVDTRALGELLYYPREGDTASYPPLGVEKRFDASVMPRVESWVRNQGQRMIFIYGENDPWSTGPFEVSARNDAWRFYVRGTGGNHGANLTRLTVDEREFALARLREWLAMPPARQSVPVEPVRFDEPTRAELFLR